MNRFRRLISTGAIIGLALGGLLIAPRAAQAQGGCYDYSTSFPSGWTVTEGSAYGSPVFVHGASGTLPNSTPGKIAGAQFGFTPERAFWSIAAGWLYTGPLDISLPHIHISFYRAGAEVAVRDYDVRPPIFNSWQIFTVDNLGGLVADTIKIQAWHALEGHPADQISIAMYPQIICSGPVTTATPSPTFVPETRTATPSVTPTDYISPTPSDTVTLTPSWTPSLTLTGATGTPGPTYTSFPTSTATAVQAGGEIFFTPQGPRTCGDIFNPCQALPFPVPPLETIELPSPTRINSVTPGGGFLTPTASPTGWTGGATSTGTITGTATGTGAPWQPTVDMYSTQAAGAAGLVGTPGTMNDPNGVPGDVFNAANEIGSYIGGFWGFLRAIQSFFLGRAGTIIAFLILVALYIVLLKLLLFILPIMLALFRWLLQILELLIPF